MHCFAHTMTVVGGFDGVGRWWWVAVVVVGGVVVCGVVGGGVCSIWNVFKDR